MDRFRLIPFTLAVTSWIFRYAQRATDRWPVTPEAWYGVWLFSDWSDLPLECTDLRAVGAVELEASTRDPYRRLSRVFHLVGRRWSAPG